MPESQKARDKRYVELIRSTLAICLKYEPKFGQGSRGLSLEEFQTLYQGDPFYTWFGLDSPLIYAAHKAAGGMTSLYRQIGTACERLFQQVLQDSLQLTAEQAAWSYTVPGAAAKKRTLSLDGRIPLDEMTSNAVPRIRKWMELAAASVDVDRKAIASLRGPVFEVRQGYKSKDAKRQNADISNAANAYANRYLPVVVLLSNQIDSDVAARYTRAQWIMLTGTVAGSSLHSTYGFMRDVVQYDLAAFFQRNSKLIRNEITSITEALLQ